jgi:hypothetical protein
MRCVAFLVVIRNLAVPPLIAAKRGKWSGLAARWRPAIRASRLFLPLVCRPAHRLRLSRWKGKLLG